MKSAELKAGQRDGMKVAPTASELVGGWVALLADQWERIWAALSAGCWEFLWAVARVASMVGDWADLWENAKAD